MPVGQLLGMVTDILNSCCSEPEWMILNVEFIKYIEFGLWDSFREGVSAHMAGTCPCTFPDLDKLLAMLYKAQGQKTFNYIITNNRSDKGI